MYSPPLSDWSFNSTPGASQSSTAPNGIAATTAWSSRAPPSKPRVLDLSPYPYEELDGASDYVDTRTAIKLLIGQALLQYASTGIAMPFEVAKILMQVQWIPKELPEGDPPGVIFEAPEEEEVEQDSVTKPHLTSHWLSLNCALQMSEASAESYFHDPAREAFSAGSRFQADPSQPPAPTDEEGYILRQSVHDDATRPDYIIPVGPTDGVWNMIKRIRAWKHEGWLALWKGSSPSTLNSFAMQFTNFIYLSSSVNIHCH